MTVSLSSATPLLGIPAEPKPAKAEDAAQQFESLLIAQMMRSAWESAPGNLSNGGLGGGENEDGEDSGSSLIRDLACQQFAQMLAKHGGIGLTRLIVQGLDGK